MDVCNEMYDRSHTTFTKEIAVTSTVNFLKQTNTNQPLDRHNTQCRDPETHHSKGSVLQS